ncbi:MAG TPA: hypothetical protein VGK93_03290, partial [Candidatus Eisenbacteria bacterium]
WTYRAALGSFFSPDDLILLERTQGLRPALPTFWRYLSGDVYFRALFPVFRSNPLPYLTVNWILHGFNVALLYAWTRRAGAVFSPRRSPPDCSVRRGFSIRSSRRWSAWGTCLPSCSR